MAVANTSSGTATVSVKLVAESGEEHTTSLGFVASTVLGVAFARRGFDHRGLTRR